MPKEVNREMYNLDVQTMQDSTKAGVLATIGGRFSTSAEPSRNDRMYTPDLWQSVVNSDRVKEMLETKTFYGELSHPPRAAEYLSEVQMDNISHNITELLFDAKSKELTGKIDILDTPSGRIAHTLLKYGSRLGISSRGIVMDSGYNNKGNVMDVDNYYLVTFDLVALPGIPNARLDPVKESLNFKRQPLLESLELLKKDITKEDANKYKKSLGVLESIEQTIKTGKDLKDDELKDEIKNLSNRDTSENIEDEEDIKADELIDRDDVEGAILEKKSESDKPKRKRRTKAELEDWKKNPLITLWKYQDLMDKVIADYIEENGQDDYDSLVEIGEDDGVIEAYYLEHLDRYLQKVALPVSEEQDIITGEELELGSESYKKKRGRSKRVEVVMEDDAGGDVSPSSEPANAPADQFSNGFMNMPKDIRGTQVNDIKGPKSVVNVLGRKKQTKPKKFLETIQNIATIEDVIKYVESLDGVERQDDGKVIINKDTVLFNTMLRLINSARLQSDANPLANLGGSIKDVKKTSDEPVNDEYDQETDKLEPIKKSIKKVDNHNSALESALSIVELTTRKLESSRSDIEVLQNENAVLEKENELLRKRLKLTTRSFNESLAETEAKVQRLTERVQTAQKVKMQAANEAATTKQSYQALESAHALAKNKLAALETENKELKDKYARVTESEALSKKDKKIFKLLEAHSLSVDSIDDDSVIRSANETPDHNGYLATENAQMATLLNRMMSKKK
jgi:hypothetical protein